MNLKYYDNMRLLPYEILKCEFSIVLYNWTAENFKLHGNHETKAKRLKKISFL